MAWARTAGVVGCTALGIAALWWVHVAKQPTLPRPGAEVDRVSPRAALSRDLPSPRLQAPLPDRGPNGREQGWVQGRKLKTQGLPPRPPAQPAADAATWDQRTRAADTRWARASVDAVERYARQQSLPEDERAALLLEIITFTTEVQRIRESIRAGSLDPAAGRSAVVVARNRVAEAMQRQLGEDAERLRKSLEGETAGGGW